jgi:hypothetical protein
MTRGRGNMGIFCQMRHFPKVLVVCGVGVGVGVLVVCGPRCKTGGNLGG